MTYKQAKRLSLRAYKKAFCAGRMPHANADAVITGIRTSANGLRHFRKTIEQLEALEV